MFGSLLSGLALFGAALSLPLEKQVIESAEAVEVAEGTIGYLPVNGGWMTFPFGPVGSVTPIMFQLYCPGRMNITDLYCSGDRFEIFDNGVCLGLTSKPIFNDCASNSTNPDYTESHHQWSSGSWDLLPGWHNISIVVKDAPYNGGYGSIRVDTIQRHDFAPCSCKTCPIQKGDLVVVNTPVPRCQADAVCRSLGMQLANVNIDNFLDATTLAFQCSGAYSQTWVDDWNGDDYVGTCLVLSTGAAAPGGAINVPSCCSTRLPVLCQKKPCTHPPVQYSCNSCQQSCHCKGRDNCFKCDKSSCSPCKSCGLLVSA